MASKGPYIDSDSLAEPQMATGGPQMALISLGGPQSLREPWKGTEDLRGPLKPSEDGRTDGCPTGQWGCCPALNHRKVQVYSRVRVMHFADHYWPRTVYFYLLLADRLTDWPMDRSTDTYLYSFYDLLGRSFDFSGVLFTRAWWMDGRMSGWKDGQMYRQTGI